jgi:hypothetical protein
MQRHRLSVLVALGAVILVVGGLFAVSGCSGGKAKAKVTGSVTMDGQPQEGARVTLIPTDSASDVPPQGGATQADGKFTFDVVPGNYKVTLTKWVDKSGKVPGASEDPTQDFTQMMESGLLTQVFPPKYSDPTNTPLSAEIPAGGKDLGALVVEK